MNYDNTGLRELLSIVGALLLIALAISFFSGCVTTQSARENAEIRYQQGYSLGRLHELQVCNERYTKLQKELQGLKSDFDKFFEPSKGE